VERVVDEEKKIHQQAAKSDFWKYIIYVKKKEICIPQHK
jgi:hypothetical protein